MNESKNIKKINWEKLAWLAIWASTIVIVSSIIVSTIFF